MKTMKNKFTITALLVLTGLLLCSATRAQSNVGGRLSRNRVIEDTEDTSVKPNQVSRPETNTFDRDRWRRRSEALSACLQTKFDKQSEHSLNR